MLVQKRTLTTPNLIDSKTRAQVMVINTHVFDILNEHKIIFEKENDGKQLALNLSAFSKLNFGEKPPLLVLFFTCHSEEFGYILKSKGVQYVIVIDKDQRINEKTTQVFAKHFFEKLYTEGICQSFIHAKYMVS